MRSSEISYLSLLSTPRRRRNMSLKSNARIRLIKERGRGILNTLPFKKMPRLMLIELVYHVVLWLNAFPANSGVSETLSPWEIVYRHKLDFAKHCKSPFGTYCEVHDEPAPTNTMVTRSNPGNSARPHWKLARDLQVSQPGNRKEGQVTHVHTVPHAGLGHQEGRSVWQIDRPPGYF